ncbi:hypothetical protein [Streptomyces syringium]|uniref:Uncharacterized protein YggU (UPF0235/DUF167 family) n=1 Tax=Streptomyces syringium TaxID=76729 RepID=A0ABS4XX51_9ACTN|nr:hypothetical protein [Streptomyces syringium]MBP2401093.1 uncharacterized protein YggU (UPF0235/DUF167 family) [Streptomyces syringium]
MVRVLVALGAVVVLSAPSPSPDSGVPEELRRTAQELREAQRGQTVRVAVKGQLELGPGNVREGVRQIAVGAREGRFLIVDLTASPRSGQAGALLALLAKEWVVPRDVVLTSLRGQADALKEVPLCSEGKHKPLCESLLKGDVKLEPGKGKPLALPTRDAASASGKGADGTRLLVLEQRRSPADRSGRPDTTDALLIALVALLSLVALAVFKTRRPVAAATTGRPLPPGFLLSGAPAPADRPAPTPTGRPRLAVVRRLPHGPVRTAVVRTCLRPQGYVEFDGWLHRATWAEPSLTPPGPGARVDVVGPGSGRLEAFAPGGPGRADARARGSTPP